jgi:hypothetical protein
MVEKTENYQRFLKKNLSVRAELNTYYTENC